MEFGEKIAQLRDRVAKIQGSLQTEEATKNALIMPFLNALGYDVFNPLEVIPEYIADSRFKKDEKVDYAIIQDGKPIILIECKNVLNDKLDIKKHAGQLFKYFTASKAKFIILTNGMRPYSYNLHWTSNGYCREYEVFRIARFFNQIEFSLAGAVLNFI